MMCPTRFNGLKIKIQTFLKSEKFHKLVVILVVIDCLCVASELLLYELGRYVLANNSAHSSCPRSKAPSTSNLTSEQPYSHPNKAAERADLFFIIVEDIFKYTSTGILSLFMAEIIVKLVFMPRMFRSKWEILDAIFVVTSLTLNLVLFTLGDTMEAVTGLIVLLRWIEFIYLRLIHKGIYLTVHFLFF